MLLCSFLLSFFISFFFPLFLSSSFFLFSFLLFFCSFFISLFLLPFLPSILYLFFPFFFLSLLYLFRCLFRFVFRYFVICIYLYCYFVFCFVISLFLYIFRYFVLLRCFLFQFDQFRSNSKKYYLCNENASSSHSSLLSPLFPVFLRFPVFPFEINFFRIILTMRAGRIPRINELATKGSEKSSGTKEAYEGRANIRSSVEKTSSPNTSQSICGRYANG